MAKSTSAIYFLVIIMAIIVCLSILVGTKTFARSGDDDLLREAEQYASSFSTRSEHYVDADVDEEDGIEMEAMDEAPEVSSTEPDDTMGDSDADDDAVEEFRSMRRKSVAVVKRPATHVPGQTDIQAFDGVELQAFAPIVI